MRLLEQTASQSARAVSLSCFKSNAGAVLFYERLGYRKVKEDEFFVELERLPSNPSIERTASSYA
jgi:ribosomal protein S18 acetylase RimI-like enzyme